MSPSYEIIPELGVGRNFISFINNSSHLTERAVRDILSQDDYLYPFLNTTSSKSTKISNFQTIEELKETLLTYVFNLRGKPFCVSSQQQNDTLGVFFVPVMIGIKNNKKVKRFSIFDDILKSNKGMSIEVIFDTVVGELLDDFKTKRLDTEITAYSISKRSAFRPNDKYALIAELSILTSLCVSYYFSIEEYQRSFSFISKILSKINEFNELEGTKGTHREITTELFCGTQTLLNYPRYLHTAIPLAFQLFVIYNFRNSRNFDKILFLNNEFNFRYGSGKVKTRQSFFSNILQQMRYGFEKNSKDKWRNVSGTRFDCMLEMMQKPTIQYMWGFIRSTFPEFALTQSKCQWIARTGAIDFPLLTTTASTDPDVITNAFSIDSSLFSQNAIFEIYSDDEFESIIVHYLNQVYGHGNRTRLLNNILEGIYNYVCEYRPNLSFSEMIMKLNEKIQNHAVKVLINRC